MINAIDHIVADLIQSQAPPLILKGGNQVGFDPPNQDWRNTVVNNLEERLNVYLFDLRESLKFRSNERRREVQSNGWSSETYDRPKLNCMYLITAWHPASPPMEPAPEEHRLLYWAAEVLLRHRSIAVDDVYKPGITIPSGRALPPEFQGQEFPIEVGLPDGTRDLGDFWSTMQGVWRPALQLSVTIPLLQQLTPFESPVVTTTIADYRQQGKPESAEVLLTIGGQVLAPTAQPVAGAWVQLQGVNPPALQSLSRRATTGADGRFVFSFLPAGDYQLQAVASGLGPITRNVTFPSPTGEYNLQF
jgi:hypothetical protein